jgi:small-conductance mechanosensitive channel
MEIFLNNSKALLEALALVGGSVLAGLILHSLLFRAVGRLARATQTVADDLLVRHGRAPVRIFVILSVLHLVLPLLRLPAWLQGVVFQALSLGLIVSVAWLIARVASAAEEILFVRHDVDRTDNLKARRIRTQVHLLKKVVVVVVGVLALAAALMTFEKVRQVGAGILASAGIVGITLGFAAQRTIATLFAGLQIAVTQPFRIDDVLVVENEWGRVEEITLTYVVLRLWDLRRLVLPITFFLDKPFQNWTRTTAEVMGAVFLYTDYTVPVQAVREELRRIVEGSPAWDGRVCTLQVTQASERSLELRCLVSSADSSRLWELRCHVREQMLAFLQESFPRALPKLRAEVLLSDAETPMDSGAGLQARSGLKGV